MTRTVSFPAAEAEISRSYLKETSIKSYCDLLREECVIVGSLRGYIISCLR
jgi:hypothetical protein